MPSHPPSSNMSDRPDRPDRPESSEPSPLQATPLATPASDATAESLAPWRSPLSRALHRNRAQPFCRYLQLATVRPEGTPANRTIVFRGFLANTNRLMFICDRRSEKTHHITQNPAAEACWYFTKTREQFRLSGHLTLITAQTNAAGQAGQQARHTVWQNISANAKIQFAWPYPKAPRAEASAFSPPAPDGQIPPPTFCLLLLSVDRVDHLALRGDPQTRTLYNFISDSKSDSTSETSAAFVGDWRTLSVNP